MRTPRECSHSRSAPLTTVSTTSLTVPPKAFLTALKSRELVAHDREAPVRADLDVQRRRRAPGSAPPTTISPRPSAASRAARAPRRPRDQRRRAPRPSRTPVAQQRRARPPATSSRPTARGAAARPRRGAGPRPGRARGRTAPCARSTPAMPSISAWWVLEISAKRLLSRPSTTHSSHSGLERSSCWEKIRAARQQQLLLAARAAAARCGGRGTRG